MKLSTTLSDSAILQELGERLAQLRLARNLSQEALAAEAGLSLRTLTRLEAGEPSQTVNLLRVLRVLGLLENLEVLIPPPAISPLQQLKLQGKTRKRASRQTQPTVAEPESPWQWQPE
ncbi:MAG: helix-turn-helix transcriptional regulator [Pseudomonadota bacterium]